MITVFSPDLTESHVLMGCTRIRKIMAKHPNKVSLGWFAIITGPDTCNRVFRLTTSVHPDTQEPYLTWETLPTKNDLSIKVRQSVQAMKLLGICK